jgi:hypothetical protein
MKKNIGLAGFKWILIAVVLELVIINILYVLIEFD